MLINHRKIIQIPSPPCRGKFLIPPDELRYELPFDPAFRNLVYIDRLSNDKWFTPLQIHDYFEMCYIAEGIGWFILDDVKHYARQGELFVTKPHEIHAGGASGNGPFTMYSLGFRFEEWNELEPDYYLLGRDRIVRDRLGAVPQWCERIMKECGSGAPYAATMGKAYFTALLTEILRVYSAEGGPNEHAGHAIPSFVKAALSAIHLTSYPNARVSELAKASGVSRSHLDREFKRLLGITPGEYSRQLQLERAKQALRQSDRTVTEIAESHGFETVQAFCMFFKRNSGMSPQQYRKLSVSGRAEGDEQKR